MILRALCFIWSGKDITAKGFIFQDDNVNITLQGDADKLFTMVQDKANSYTNMTGQAAFPY